MDGCSLISVRSTSCIARHTTESGDVACGWCFPGSGELWRQPIKTGGRPCPVLAVRAVSACRVLSKEVAEPGLTQVPPGHIAIAPKVAITFTTCMCSTQYFILAVHLFALPCINGVSLIRSGSITNKLLGVPLPYYLYSTAEAVINFANDAPGAILLQETLHKLKRESSTRSTAFQGCWVPRPPHLNFRFRVSNSQLHPKSHMSLLPAHHHPTSCQFMPGFCQQRTHLRNKRR